MWFSCDRSHSFEKYHAFNSAPGHLPIEEEPEMRGDKTGALHAGA